LSGRISPGKQYHLDVSAHPMVNRDRYSVAVTDGEQFTPTDSNELVIQNRRAAGDVASQWRYPIEVTFEPT
ncbi:MAG: hypothetical protein WD029_04155, partial [Microthrixaceae bacterium]